MLTSESFGELAAALAAFNAAAVNPIADQVAKVHSKRTNSDFTYPYAELGGITDVERPELAKHGLSIWQNVVYADGRGWIGTETTIVWGNPGVPAEWVRFDPVWVPIPDEGSPQDIGKAISYSRRYGYLAALGLAARESSDGPPAGDRRHEEPAQSRASRPAPPAAPAAIGSARAAALIAMANRKGKTAEDVRSFAAAAGHDGPLEKAPPAIADRLGRRLEGMPDLFDANGEALSPASAPSGEPQADSPEATP